MNTIFQEATAFNYGTNFVPNQKRFSVPVDPTDTTIFILSNSFEYDVQMIKDLPAPKSNFHNIIIPSVVNTLACSKPYNYSLSPDEYKRRKEYLIRQKLIPPLTVMESPYNDSNDNRYVAMSDVIKTINTNIKSFTPDYLQKNIYLLFEHVFKPFNFTKKKVLWIDTTRYDLDKNADETMICSNLINSLLSSYIINEQRDIKQLKDWTIIFHGDSVEYRFDLGSYEKRDDERLKAMLNDIGKGILNTIKQDDEIPDESKLDDLREDEDTDEDNTTDDDSTDNSTAEDVPEIEDEEHDKSSGNINMTIKRLVDTYDKPGDDTIANRRNMIQEESKKKNQLLRAKSLAVRANLIRKINPDSKLINNFSRLSDILKDNGNNPVENDIINDSVKKLSETLAPVNNIDVMNTVSSPREQEIRTKVGQVKLDNIDFDTITSVADIPLPAPVRPRNITTTNPAIQNGIKFINFSKEYEDKLLNRDIVATLMKLSSIPDGFYVTGVEVTDASTVTTLANNWRVTLRNKKSDKQSVINIKLPRLMNGRFLNNGIWYNITKQDFPIPILKIDKKHVIMTSNYHKITVERHDTKSLVDIGAFAKVIKSRTTDAGNPYIINGSSISTNSKFVSTIEFDEFAKMWRSFTNKEADCVVLFNRQECLNAYGFVSVQPNEFCCGMINKVPLIINTDTGLTRAGKTLTNTLLDTLSDELKQSYFKIKPSKMTMYSEITIGIKIPLGVAIAAWEGISELLKKSGCKYQFVDKSFNDVGFIQIPFKDKILAVQNTIQNQLIFNGFYRINTKAHNMSEFEDPIMNSNSIYVDIFNQTFFRQYSQITTFVANYNFFVDAITKDVCLHYNLPTDICGMLIYASNILADNNFMSEANSSLYRVRTSEVIPAILHYRLAVAISKYNNKAGSKTRDNTLSFNPNEIMHELLSTPGIEPISALNPSVELHAMENVSKVGFSGVNNDRAYSLERRAYDESMIGKMAISSPNNGGVGITRQLVADPKIESVRGYTSTAGVDTDFKDTQLASFSELVTSGTITRDDAIRSAIATSQTSHIVPTDNAEPTLVSNGIDEIVPACLSEEFSVIAEEDGKVLESQDGYMIVQYKSGKKKAINVDNRYSFNTESGFYVNNKLLSNFQPGDSFFKDDILAYHEKFFTKDTDGTVRMNIGPLAKVAFMGLYSTYEDAGMITTKMSQKLSTHLTMRQTSKLSITDDIESIVKVGDEVDIHDPLIVFGMGDTGDKATDNFLKAFGGVNSELLTNAKRVVRSDYAGHVVDVKMYTTKSLDKLSPSLYKIFDEYYKENVKRRRILDKHDSHNDVYKLDTLYTLPTGPLPGNTIKGITCDILIEIYIEHDYDAGVGDKLVIYGASKQIISETIPEGMEPYAESRPDEEISLLVAPSSILKRMIPSLTIIASANKVLIETKKLMNDIWNGKA